MNNRAGYRLCRRCGYDFVSDGPQDRICEDCTPRKARPAPPRRVRLDTIPAPVEVDLSPEACAARWVMMERIVKGAPFTPH